MIVYNIANNVSSLLTLHIILINIIALCDFSWLLFSFAVFSLSLLSLLKRYNEKKLIANKNFRLSSSKFLSIYLIQNCFLMKPFHHESLLSSDVIESAKANANAL